MFFNKESLMCRDEPSFAKRYGRVNFLKPILATEGSSLAEETCRNKSQSESGKQKKEKS